jgi:hypothetical protein
MCSARWITDNQRLIVRSGSCKAAGRKQNMCNSVARTNENCLRQPTQQVCVRVLPVPTRFGTAVDE